MKININKIKAVILTKSPPKFLEKFLWAPLIIQELETDLSQLTTQNVKRIKELGGEPEKPGKPGEQSKEA